jgi:uncharacterized protein YceK
MRKLILIVALVSGCATVNRTSGANGAAAVSGETKTGASTDSIATSGSAPTDTAR